MRRLILTTLFGSLLLVGCGFHLRGLNNQLSEQFKKTYLVENNGNNTDLNQQVASLITLNGGHLVNQTDANVKIIISPLVINSRQLAISGDSTLKEYEKIYRVNISIVSQNNGSRIGQRTITSIQQEQYDEKNVLASDEQSKITQNAAIRDLANEIIRYLTIIK